MLPEDLFELSDLGERWVAIDTQGGYGLRELSSGAVLVDYDTELDALCVRMADAGRRSLTIFRCNRAMA